jgi:hypothetical protein
LVEIITEIEKASGDLYYPKTAEAVIRNSMPYAVNTATINVAEAIASISNIAVYDQVELQIDDRVVFSGRLDVRRAMLGKGGSSFEYPLTDHGQVMQYINVSTLKSWAVPTAIGTIIENIRSSFINSDLTGTNIATGPNIAEYNVPAWSKTVFSSYQELAKMANYNLWVDFDKDIHFAAKNTTAKDGFAVIEGKNLISLDSYEEDIWQVRNYIKVIGDTGFSAVAQDAGSQTSYHKREYVYTDPSLGSNAVCQEMADALIQADPPERIRCTVHGDLNVDAGDMVHVDIPTYSISGDYTVSEVEIRINKQTFETGLQLGETLPDIMHVIASVSDRIQKIEGGYT